MVTGDEKLDFKDFEDGVQNFVAGNYACNCIITRNKKDDIHSQLKVITSKEYLLIHAESTH